MDTSITRIRKAVSYLEDALRFLGYMETNFNIKSATSSIKNAKTLIYNIDGVKKPEPENKKILRMIQRREDEILILKNKLKEGVTHGRNRNGTARDKSTPGIKRRL
jgi:hypothetical protein